MDDSIPTAYAQHTINILRVAAGQRQQAFEALKDLEASLVGKIATATTPNNLARFQALQEQTQGSIAKTYATPAAKPERRAWRQSTDGTCEKSPVPI